MAGSGFSWDSIRANPNLALRISVARRAEPIGHGRAWAAGRH